MPHFKSQTHDYISMPEKRKVVSNFFETKSFNSLDKYVIPIIVNSEHKNTHTMHSYLFIHAFWNIMFKFKTVLKTLYFVGPKPSLIAPYSFKTFFKVHVLAACWLTNITNIDQLEGVRLNGCILFTPRYNGQCWMIVFNNLGGVHPFYFMVLKSQINTTCPNLFNEILV